MNSAQAPAWDGPDEQPASSVLFASHTPPSSHFTVGSHHLSRELSRAGLTVGHLSTPLSPVKLVGAGNREGLQERWSTWLQGPRRSASGCSNAVPLTLLPVQATAGWAVNAGLRSAVPSLRRVVEKMGLGHVDHLLVDQPFFAGLGRLLGAGTVVYRPTDVYTDRRLLAAQARLVREADAVVATSQQVLDALPEPASALPSMVLSNGVEARAFSAAAGHVERGPAVVYVGALDARTDWPWLGELARCLPGVHIDLYGPRSGGAHPDLVPGVRLRGPVDYAALPALLQSYRVGLLPFASGPANGGRSPMKLFEYLAAGLHVVATPHFAQAAAAPPGVNVLGDPAAAAEAVRRLLETTDRNPAGRAAAAEQDWSRRAAALWVFLRSLETGSAHDGDARRRGRRLGGARLR